jgi:hypothetical protein
MKRPVLGHIDCPACGTVAGMSITHDRNGEPYGYCEANCDAQLRIGGKARRVAAFIARYPWAKGEDVTPEPKKTADPVPEPEQVVPKPKKSAFAQVLEHLNA